MTVFTAHKESEINKSMKEKDMTRGTTDIL